MFAIIMSSAFAGNFHINLDPEITVISDGDYDVWAYFWDTYVPSSPFYNLHVLGTYYGEEDEMDDLKVFFDDSPNGHPGISAVFGAVQTSSGAYPYKRQVGFAITSAQASDLSGESGFFCATSASVIEDWLDCEAIAVVPMVNFVITF
jgi:hypothetical protein